MNQNENWKARIIKIVTVAVGWIAALAAWLIPTNNALKVVLLAVSRAVP